MAQGDPRKAPDPILEIYQAFVFTANTIQPDPFPCRFPLPPGEGGGVLGGVPDRHPGPGPPDRPLGPAARTGPPGRHPDRSPGLAPGTSVPLTPGRTDKFKEETLPRLQRSGDLNSTISLPKT